MRIKVVLPAPFGPRMAKIIPRRTSRSIPFTAGTAPKRLTSPRAEMAMDACSSTVATLVNEAE
jgi:hypothetical protein